MEELEERSSELEAALEGRQKEGGYTGTRDKLRRLQRVLRGNLGAVEQVDGSTFYFDPTEEMKTVFLFFSYSLRSVHDNKERPEPPAVVKAVANAKDRKRAYEKLPLSHMLPRRCQGPRRGGALHTSLPCRWSGRG